VGYLRLNDDGTWETDNPEFLCQFIDGTEVVETVVPGNLERVFTYLDGEAWLRTLETAFRGNQGLAVGPVVEMPDLGLTLSLVEEGA
jgi:hypothetical protein